jgi:hypothetical protein
MGFSLNLSYFSLNELRLSPPSVHHQQKADCISYFVLFVCWKPPFITLPLSFQQKRRPSTFSPAAGLPLPASPFFSPAAGEPAPASLKHPPASGYQQKNPPASGCISFSPASRRSSVKQRFHLSTSISAHPTIRHLTLCLQPSQQEAERGALPPPTTATSSLSR